MIVQRLEESSIAHMSSASLRSREAGARNRQSRRAFNNMVADMETNWDLLVRAVANAQDKQAFSRLFDHYAPRVKALMIKMGLSPDVAEEIAQETFVIVWRKAASFDPEKAAASTWIFTIARNKRIDRLRKISRPEPDPHDPAFVPQAPSESHSVLTERERSDRIKQVVETLPEAQRTVLMRAYYQDETQAEIAKALNAPLGTVKSRLRLALEKLRQTLEEEMKDGSL